MQDLVASIQASFAIAKGLIAARDEQKIMAVKADLLAQLATALELAVDTIRAKAEHEALIAHLKQEIASMQNWAAEAQTYALTETARGLFTYIKQDNQKPLESTPKLCANCFDQGHKSILQLKRVPEGRQLALVCDRCRAEHVFRHFADAEMA